MRHINARQLSCFLVLLLIATTGLPPTSAKVSRQSAAQTSSVCGQAKDATARTDGSTIRVLVPSDNSPVVQIGGPFGSRAYPTYRLFDPQITPLNPAFDSQEYGLIQNKVATWSAYEQIETNTNGPNTCGVNVTLNPISGPPGTVITVTGSGWPYPGDAIEVCLWACPVDTIQVDNNGNFHATLAVPADTPLGGSTVSMDSTISPSHYAVNFSDFTVTSSPAPTATPSVPAPVPTPPSPPTSVPPTVMPSPLPTGSCNGGVGMDDIRIAGPLRFEVTSVDLLNKKTLKLEYNVTGQICPETPISVAPIKDGVPQKNPSITIRSSGGETKVTRSGDIETTLPVSKEFINKPVITQSLIPPSVSLAFSQKFTTGANDFRLEEERRVEAKSEINPPATDLSYLVALGKTATYLIAFLIALGVTEAVVLVAPAINVLLLHYQGPSPQPIQALHVQSVIFTSTTSVQASNRLSQDVIDDLTTVFGPEFTNASTINTLNVDSEQKGAGQNIAFNGSNFVPGGLVYISLRMPNEPNVEVKTQVRTDSNGNINGQIQIPSTAKLGRWLLTAIDMSVMYNQLQNLGNGTSTSLHFNLQAANVIVSASSGAPPDNSFADNAFQSVWERTDLPIARGASGLQARSWIWGPQPITSGSREPYAEGQGGTRLVQYFDKSRMEINHADAPRNQWYVTNGLLVVEMIEGRIQLGDTAFQDNVAANEAVAGDPASGNPNAPTYRSFRSVAYPVNSQRASRRTSQVVTEVLARDGTTSQDPSLSRYNIKLEAYDEQLGHNIPKVFTTFFTQQGLVFENGRYVRRPIIDWLFVMGLPISEPFWTRVKIGGIEKDVLMQAFQRRVLTYTPDNAPEWRVEMGNVGQHYLRWRYGQ